MNSDQSHDPGDGLEARLTALLLGELTEDEAAALRRAIEQDPALSALHERLKHALSLVREAAADPAGQTAAPPAPLKLSEDRRQKLLAHFKTVELAVPPRRRGVHWLVPMSAAAALVVMIGARILAPGAFTGRSLLASRTAASENHVRLLEGAREQWAMEHGKSPGDAPTSAELADYFKGGAVKPVAGETYDMDALGKPATTTAPREGGEKPVTITTSGTAGETTFAFALPKEPAQAPGLDSVEAQKSSPPIVATTRSKAKEIFLPGSGNPGDGEKAQLEARADKPDLNSAVNGPVDSLF